MPKIFISYRREDSAPITGRIYDRLTDRAAFGTKNIFKDVDTIPFGADFREFIDEAMSIHDAVLVIIGPHWLTISDEHGERRLDDPKDFVRIEVETALKRGNLAVPVLVNGASMPDENELPDDIRDLAYRNAALVRNDPDFHQDMTRLIENLKRSLKERDKPKSAQQRKRSVKRLVAGFLMVVAAFAAILLATNIGQNGEEPALSETATPTLIASQTPVPPSPTLTDTPALTVTPSPVTPAASPTFIPSGTRNEDWTPVIETLGALGGPPSLGDLPMVYVPAGCFVMGSVDGLWDEQPPQQVCLSDFWISQTEITNAQYAVCVNQARCDGLSDSQNPDSANYPVVFVDWFDAIVFAQWAGGMLPTEAQWEYAARGPENWVYPWGNSLPTCDQANTAFCTETDGIQPVGRPAGASWVGAWDMEGNVWEWVLDWYAANSYSKLTRQQLNPTGPEARTNRVWRSSSWYIDDAKKVQSTYRTYENPLSAYEYLGFRIVIPGQAAPVELNAACNGAPAPHVEHGMVVEVTEDEIDPKLNVRLYPELGAMVLAQVTYPDTLTIVDGPVCADGYLWWLVELENRLRGWAAEGNEIKYFYDPVP